MKAKYKLLIIDTSAVDGTVTLDLSGKGQVEGTNISAKESTMDCTIKLRGVAAKNITLGSTITVTVSDEEVEV